MKKSKIYINGKIIGTCDDPEDFVASMREKRRSGEVSPEMNITHYHETDEIYLFTDPGRTRRPLIVVEDGASKLTDEHIQQLEEGELTWNNLINQGIIEYMDAEEEENSYISMFPEDINEFHTHLEIRSINHARDMCWNHSICKSQFISKEYNGSGYDKTGPWSVRFKL